MSVIFNLRDEPCEWASEFNQDIEYNFPIYFEEHPRLGAPEWWANTTFDISRGKIKHVGLLMDEGTFIDVVLIEPLDEDFNGFGQPEYMVYREDFWLNDAVALDKFVETESISILPTGELDESSIYIETKVRVW